MKYSLKTNGDMDEKAAWHLPVKTLLIKKTNGLFSTKKIAVTGAQRIILEK